MFTHKEEHDYFWVSHGQLAQVASVVLVAAVLTCSVITRPTITSPQNVTPINFTDMQDHFTSRIQGLYLTNNTYKLTSAPLLRQVLYHNLLPCEPNFLENHNLTDCDVEAKQDVSLYLRPLTDAPDPFEYWEEDLCGCTPFNPAKNRYSTGQSFFPSRKCELCFHPSSGYVLQLPIPPAEPQLNASFLPTCVLKPIQIWFEGHVREDTFAIISDALFISKDKRTIKRDQLSYERLLPLDLWWPIDRPETHYRHLWLPYVSASFCLVVFLYQVCASVMESHGGGQHEDYFPRIARKGLHFLLITLSFVLFVLFCVYNLRWENLIRAVTIGSPLSALADDEVKHSYVRQMYQALTSHAVFDTSVMWLLVVLLLLQVINLLTCTKGYIYGTCHTLRRLLPPLLVAGCWAVLLGLLAHVFHRESNLVFTTLKISFETLFITRYLNIKYEEESSIHLLLLLHVTIFLLIPLFVGLLMANLDVSRALKRGKKRWWARSQ